MKHDMGRMNHRQIMKKQMNEKMDREILVRRYLGRRMVSPLSCRRGVETMMEEAGFVFFMS